MPRMAVGVVVLVLCVLMAVAVLPASPVILAVLIGLLAAALLIP